MQALSSPKFVDVIVQRWQGLSKAEAVLEGDDRKFAEIAAERRKPAAAEAGRVQDAVAV